MDIIKVFGTNLKKMRLEKGDSGNKGDLELRT